MQLNATLVRVKDRDEAIAAMESGRVDAFASDKLLLYGAEFKDTTGAPRCCPTTSRSSPMRSCCRSGDWELRLAVNTALAEIFRSGEIDKIFAPWFGQLGLQPRRAAPARPTCWARLAE